MYKSGDSRLTDFRRTRENTPAFLRPSFHRERNFNITEDEGRRSRGGVVYTLWILFQRATLFRSQGDRGGGGGGEFARGRNET